MPHFPDNILTAMKEAVINVLSGIDLSDLLRRMRDVAVQKRIIYVAVTDILQGAV